jgi:excinuclease UvrABC nuclease subunit
MAKSDEVIDAFDIVLGEVEKAVKDLNNDGSQAFQSGDYEKAKNLTDKGSKMTAFREKVLILKE